jgi:CHAD domain-containing protein
LNARLAAALHERWRTFHQALKRCRQKFSTRAVHECRVEARRLLSNLDLIQSLAPQERFRKGRRPIRKCLKLLQPLRDVQVQENLARQSAIASFPLIRLELAKQRRRYRKKAVRGIKSLEVQRARDLSEKMEELLYHERAMAEEAAIRQGLLKRLTGLYRTVIELRRDIDPGNVETIHRVRVAFKKFRYTIEPVRGLLKEFSSASMQDIKSLQEALGSLQDTDVYLRWLDKWIRKRPAMIRPLALFRHWLLCLRPHQIRESIDWLDRLPADWQGGPFLFASQGSKRSRNGSLGGRSRRKRDTTTTRELAPVRTRRGSATRKDVRRTRRSRSAGSHPAA